MKYKTQKQYSSDIPMLSIYNHFWMMSRVSHLWERIKRTEKGKDDYFREQTRFCLET